MNRTRSLTVALLLLVPALPLALSTGCKTPAQTVAYRSLKATIVTVDNAMQAYAELVMRGQVTAEKQMRVKAIHDKYRVAVIVAVKAARFNYSSATPDEVAKLAGDLTAEIGGLL